MKANECTRAFVGPITEPGILPAAQAVLQGRSFKKLILNLPVAPETWHFTNELQMQIRPFEFSLPLLYEIQLCGKDLRNLCDHPSG